MTAAYDPTLALLSIGVAIFGMMSVVALTAQLREASLPAPQMHIALLNGALTVGIVIWASHFIAMRALAFPVSADQQVIEMALSIAITICIAWLGLYLANLWGAAGRLLGGIVVGIAIIGMHSRPIWYALGCGAECNEGLMITLAAASIAASTGAIWIGFRKRAVWSVLVGGCILGVATALTSYAGLVGTYAVPSADSGEWSAHLFGGPLIPYAVAGGVAVLSIGNIALFAAITKHRLTRERIELVQWTYNQVESAGLQVADLFYQRLFEIAPQTRSMFPSDLSQQKNKLLDVLAGAVLNLHQLDSVMASIKDLGRRHVYYGVGPEHYKSVGDALIWTLEHVLGRDFTPATKRAWVAAYKTLASSMMAAAAEVDRPRIRQRVRVSPSMQ